MIQGMTTQRPARHERGAFVMSSMNVRARNGTRPDGRGRDFKGRGRRLRWCDSCERRVQAARYAFRPRVASRRPPRSSVIPESIPVPAWHV